MTCTPQTGSRTSRREVRADCCWAADTLGCLVRVLMNPRSIQTTTRRNIAKVQHSTTSQIKNRIIREKNSNLLILPVAIVCKGKRRSQTKSSDFNSLRGEEFVASGTIWGGNWAITSYLSVRYAGARRIYSAAAESGISEITAKQRGYGRCPCTGAIRLG